jgi:hypothetical protein
MTTLRHPLNVWRLLESFQQRSAIAQKRVVRCGAGARAWAGSKTALLFEKRRKNICTCPGRLARPWTPVRGTGSKSFLVLFCKKELLP